MKKTLFEELQSIAKKYWVRFVLGFILILISNSLLILNPLTLRKAIINIESTPTNIYYWVTLLVIISLLSSLFKYYMRIQFIAISRDVELEIRSKIFERIQMQSKTFFDRHGIGELLSRMTNDISTYRDVLGPGILYPFNFITLVIPALFALISLSFWLSLLSLIPIIIIPFLVLAIKKRTYNTSIAVQQSLADMSSMVHEHFSGIRILKSYSIENETLSRFKILCQSFNKFSLILACLQGLFFPLLTFITKIITVLLVLASGALILLGWGHLNRADFVSFMWIQSYIFAPILMLGWILPVYERGKAAYKRLLEIYEEPIEVKDRSLLELKIPLGADILIKNLTFTYPTASLPTLHNLNLNIPGGTFLGITGPIGSGKTTLFRLLNREYEIPKDRIFIGEHDIHDYKLEAFREEIISVEQVPFLFSKTIAENVRFGKGDATIEEIIWVTTQADLHETITEFPNQYETLVGERGVTLSGGQKQRLAVARAFLVNHSILFLDDIFAAVDNSTEKRIFSAMRKNLKGKTVLLITHRASILEQMDRVIYLFSGKIVEDGSPEELKKKKGYYSALIDLQKLNQQGDQ